VGAAVSHSVLMHGVKLHPRAVVRDAILDKNVEVPEGAVVGIDKDADRSRGYTVSANGITVVGKGEKIIP
jgi:glucose-1-phosphate adenylyltransferase